MPEFRVFATAGEAYGFLFREFGTILRLTWLPLLVAVIIQNFITIAVLPEAIPGPGAVLAHVSSPAGLFGWAMIWIANIFGTAIAAVALHRVILFGEHRRGQFFNLHFGRTEWLFVAVSLIAIAVMAVLAGVCMAVLFLMPPWMPPWFLMPFVLVTVLAVIYFGIRFSLIFPVLVVEGRLDFEQSLQLTRGRFWRLFGLWLVVIIPAAIVVGVLQHLAAFGSLAIDYEKLATTAMDTPTLIKITIVQFLSAIVFGALGVAILSYSYKALSGRAPDDTLAPQA